MDLEDLQPLHLVGQRDLYLAVQAAGAQQGRVQRVRLQGGGGVNILQVAYAPHTYLTARWP